MTRSHTRPADAEVLFQPIKVGDLMLPNRIAMAPLTRNRASAGNVPTELNATYYAQRASAGLIIAEATQISPEGRGYIATPGIHSPEQIAGWKKVTSAVHEKDGRIVLQLWHVGRISHVSLQPDGRAPVAPSAIRADAKTFVADGFVDVSAPRALELDEIPGVIDSYRQAAANAREAGFDGVEVHGANGYLIDQFLRDGTNQRTDRYGGSVANRARLLLDVVEAVSGVYGADRVGVRLSPLFSMLGMSDSAPETTFRHAASALGAFDLAYLHVVERRGAAFDWRALRSAFGGRYIANGGYDRDSAEAAIGAAEADLVAFGTPFIANPDLVERFRRGAPPSTGDRATYYRGGAQGYTDYPTLDLDLTAGVPADAGDAAA